MISTQIQAIVGQLNAVPSFFYGTPKELNVKLDKNTVWPTVCLYPIAPIPAKYTLSNAVSNTFSIQVKFLFKSEFDQFTTDNDTLVTQALAIGNEFMVKLANYRETHASGRFFKVHKNDSATFSPLYNDFDINLTGVKLAMTVSTMYNDNVSLPPYP